LTVRGDSLETAVAVGWPDIDGSFVVLVDEPARELPDVRSFLARAAAVHVVVGRPTPADADSADRFISETGVQQVVSLGAGLVIDAAKLAIFNRQARTGEIVRHFAIPCGPEPYRAVTPFAMYDAEPGARAGVWEEWLRPREAAIVPELFEQLDAAVVALFAGDSAVHAVESLLSKLTTDTSKRHAVAAAMVFVAEAEVEVPDRVRLAVASIQAAVAFDTTKLGLAHALSRPLGIAAGVSHDSYNLMLGAPTVRFWGDEVIAASPIGDAFPGTTSADWAALLDGYRCRAGLPASLSAMPLACADVEAAIAWAPNSSGMPNLPKALQDGDLERLIADAWQLNPERRMA
jgi:alcohol dehydrogenase class IV